MINWNINIYEDEYAIGNAVSDVLIQELSEQQNAFWCLASGDSTKQSYVTFSEKIKSQNIDINTLKICLLDEWLGLKDNYQQSCDYFIRNTIINPLQISQNQYIYFDTNANPEQEVQRVKEQLEEQQKFDTIVLGVGLNGHIGFNEPSDTLATDIHITDLSSTSLIHPMVNDLEEKPNGGISMGIKNILDSKRIIVIVYGEKKLNIMRQCLSTGITTQLPLTLLKLHNNVHIFTDTIVARAFSQ